VRVNVDEEIVLNPFSLQCGMAEDVARIRRFPAPVARERVTPTEVALVVSEMLRAADISLFDLAMWYRRGKP